MCNQIDLLTNRYATECERERERERERDEGEISIKHVEIVFMFSWNFTVFLWAYIISYISLLNMANIQKVESSAANGKGYLVNVYVIKLKKSIYVVFLPRAQWMIPKKLSEFHSLIFIMKFFMCWRLLTFSQSINLFNTRKRTLVSALSAGIVMVIDYLKWILKSLWYYIILMF